MNGEPFLDRIPCGILKLRTDENFTILYSNQAIKTLFQTPASLKDMVCESEYAELLTEIRSQLTGQAASFELEFKAKIQKSCIWCSLQMNYIPEEDILYCAISDITCMKKFQEHLRIREEQYRLASRHSGSLVSIYDIPSRTLSPSPEFSRTFPFPYTLPLSPEFLIENGIVHKESVTDFLEFYDNMEKGVPEGKCITRLKTGSGDYHWFSTHYSLVCTEEQKPLRGIISYQDITDQYEKELAYQKWMEYMREQKKDCIGYYEYNLKFDLFEEIIGEMTQTMPEYVSNSFSSIMTYIAENHIFEEDREMFLKFFNKNQLLYHFYRGNRSLRLEHRRLRPDGSVYWGLGMVQIVSDPYTDTIKSFILIKDIDASKREALTLQELSKQDSLTGLLNRATAIHAIRNTLKNSQGHHILIMLDIDRFKQLNDNYGHQFGDKALHRAASRLKSALRRDDIFGRLGGDEFIILLKDVAYSMDLYARLENLCSLIGSALEPEAHISGSLGTAAYPEDGTVFEELYEKADIALYHAKKHGRSQYAVYEPGMSMANL
ncbi:sensor domain-containing diguanylate cyclase [Lacrimispora sp.]|jgi:diguanylate cyclase (GGDEF)-like protein|uniref:sensor domain-containing diguanylate cyclase n=2 Tax=Lacrimispora sp. TaxID=2719234 RepID=UPI0028AEDAF5|nr:sensor domain-containing diguanylate cyclase [Lacrimispora sp.]